MLSGSFILIWIVVENLYYPCKCLSWQSYSPCVFCVAAQNLLPYRVWWNDVKGWDWAGEKRRVNRQGVSTHVIKVWKWRYVKTAAALFIKRQNARLSIPTGLRYSDTYFGTQDLPSKCTWKIIHGKCSLTESSITFQILSPFFHEMDSCKMHTLDSL